MSGTSADALDAVLVDINGSTCEFIEAVDLPLDVETREQILRLAVPGADEIGLIEQIEKAITQLSIEAVKKLCKKANINHDDVTAIGSHGQTVRHIPPTANHNGFTLQVGDPNAIAEACKITTVADFRRRDMFLGGHGAPLVPAFHQSVFGSDIPRAIINIGGVSNITWLGEEVFGFDIGPGNNLMDDWCQQYFNQAFDRDSLIALSGKVNLHLLEQLMQHPYYSLPAPKSTGRETFNLQYVNACIDAAPPHRKEDSLATLNELSAQIIANTVKQLDQSAQSEVYICGGGAMNPLLMKRIATHLEPRLVTSTENLGIAPQGVEGAAFAWLAYRTLNGLTGNLPSVTGACAPCILGGIYPKGT